MILRNFDPQTEYPALLALFNAVWPDQRRTLSEMEAREREPREHGFLERRVVEQDGCLVGEVSLRQWPRWKGTGRFWLTLNLHPNVSPEPRRETLFRWGTERLQALKATAVYSWTRSDRPERVAFLRSRGFVVAEEEWVSAITLAHFNSGQFDQHVSAVVEAGIVVNSLAQLRHADPAWFERLYDLDNAAHADVPDVIEFTPRTQEQLRRRLKVPDIIPEGYFVAVDQSGETPYYVGLSRLGRRAADPDQLDTGLTGVRPAYRRRGIALTMKVAALRWARAAGYTHVWTANEKANPMYDLNLQLGFEPQYAGMTFEKRLA